jgi:hypothetical protein
MCRSTIGTSLVLLLSCKEKPESESTPDAAASAAASAPLRLDCVEQSNAKVRAEVAAGTAPRGGTISDAEAVVASLRPRFKACYQRGLAVDPSLQGCVVLRTFVAPSGTVEKSAVFVREGLTDAVIQCLEGAVQSAKFAPPGGTGSALQIPVTFELPVKR